MMLPNWLEAILPPLREPTRISYADGLVIVTRPDGGEESFTVGKPEELRAVQYATQGEDLLLEDSFEAQFGDKSDGDFSLGVFFPVSKNFSSWLHTYTDKDRLESLERAYEVSLRNHIRYQANPTDFETAYDFIDSHPAFWTAHDMESMPWYWETEGHGNKVWHGLMKDDDGTLIIAMETGAHVANDTHPTIENYTTHYHDYRLDVYAATFEEAYVLLAAQVDKFFFPDGTEKPDVPHEKPDWIITLEERLREIEEDGDSK